MMEGINREALENKYAYRGVTGQRSERGDLIVWIRDELNEANRRDGKREVTAGEVARRVQGIPTKDLGRDLYYVKGEMQEALQSGFPVGASFYGTVKRMRESLRAQLQQL